MPPPLILKKRMNLNSGSSSKSAAIQAFPWTLDSVAQLWGGQCAREQWKKMLDDFADALVVVHGEYLQILHTQRNIRASRLCLNAIVENAPRIAWALRSSHPYEPLVIHSDNCNVFVFNVKESKYIGFSRGHGAPITAIAVHPTKPNIFATTSRDFTTRIYNLDLQIQPVDNPSWPPWEGPCSASAAQGMTPPDSEGSGPGRCIQILVGGRSGGHHWDVLDASFHPRLSLIATCGMDRHAKIWRLSCSDPDGAIVLEDKPLFSSAIHTSRILTIRWLADDVLFTHAAPSLFRRWVDESDNEEEEPPIIEPGAFGTWKWLGFRRYFPDLDSDPSLCGGSSDYQSSTSYTWVSKETLPSHSAGQSGIPILGIFEQAGSLELIINYPNSEEFIFFKSNLRKPALLPELRSYDLVEMTKKMRLDPATGPLASPADHTSRLALSLNGEANKTFLACALTAENAVVVGAGTLWIFSRQ